MLCYKNFEKHITIPTTAEVDDMLGAPSSQDIELELHGINDISDQTEKMSIYQSL